MSRVTAVSVIFLISSVFISAGCGSENGVSTVLKEDGVLTGDEATDPNHGQLPYDQYLFSARSLDTVAVHISTDDFVPLLRLMEVSTGAALDEWDAGYAERDHMEYTIALSGEYEVRVYSTDGNFGDYTIEITVK